MKYRVKRRKRIESAIHRRRRDRRKFEGKLRDVGMSREDEDRINSLIDVFDSFADLDDEDIALLAVEDPGLAYNLIKLGDEVDDAVH